MRGRSNLISRAGQKGGGILVFTARKTRRPPTIGSGGSNLTSRVGQKGGRDTVHWPTGVHQDGAYTRWNGYCLMRGLVGQDKSYFMLARARGRILARARARLRLRALARACARAFAPTVAGACRDMTSLGPSSFGDHVVGVITQSPSQMQSW